VYQAIADSKNQVKVLQRDRAKPALTNPGDRLFCAMRVWDQQLEHGKLAKTTEDAFFEGVQLIVRSRTVTNQKAVTDYLALWQVRATLAMNPPEDIVLQGIEGAVLTKEQEENVESRHMKVARGNVVPGHLTAYMTAICLRDNIMAAIGRLGEFRWGVLHAAGGARFICPDMPANQLYIPINRRLALIARELDQEINDVTVYDLNQSCWKQAHRLVFGHPKDIDDFCERSVAGS